MLRQHRAIECVDADALFEHELAPLACRVQRMVAVVSALDRRDAGNVIPGDALSDDGERLIDGIPGKQIKEPARRKFRSFWLKVQE